MKLVRKKDENGFDDPADIGTRTSAAAKKVVSSFKKQQAKWEEAIPFRKKTSPENGKQPPFEIRDSRNTKFQKRGSKSDVNVPESVARASMMMPQIKKSELDDLPMASAKPSAIRAAAKKTRISSRAETLKAKERQRKATEQQMKMQKYRDEISVIKEEENAEKKAPGSKNKFSDHAVQKVLNKVVTEEDENAVLGYKEDFQSDDITTSDKDEGEGLLSRPIQRIDRNCTRLRRMDVLKEMKGSFLQLDCTAANDTLSEVSEIEKQPSTPVNFASMSLSLDPPRQREYQADKGRLRQAPRRVSSVAEGDTFKKRDAPPRRQKSSNLVPEMRRRPTQRDLLFDDADIKISQQKVETKKFKGTGYNKQKMLNQKQEKEKQQVQEQKKKLDEAEEAFKRGHNLCWQLHDSASALGEYRTALFIRESLLGKYHEQTGRTYFWIAKSLVKLNECAEALVAFSRALRIFERVVRKEHKYFKWNIMAIDLCIEQMDDGTNVDAYKARLNASIRFEREGDVFRKEQDFPEAVAKYRDAIGHVEEYHPDAADLYSKIALILRQDGDFERALEEYRFASEIYEMSLGPDHPETVKALNEVMEKKRLGQLSNMLKSKLNLKR